MRIIFDSSVFVAFFNKNDTFHKDTVDFIHALIDKEEIVVILPVLVFLEVTNTLSKKAIKFSSEALFDIFDKYEKLDLNYETAKTLIPIFKKVNLKTSDAIILGTAVLNNATFITWDEKFKKQAEKLVATQTPKTLFT